MKFRVYTLELLSTTKFTWGFVVIGLHVLCTNSENMNMILLKHVILVSLFCRVQSSKYRPDNECVTYPLYIISGYKIPKQGRK